MDRPPVDAFILFNEREHEVAKIVYALESHGITTFFSQRDIPPGAPWKDVESDAIETARTICVFLGKYGWGPNHLRSAARHADMGRKAILVLIAEPPKGVLDHAQGLFHTPEYIDLQNPSSGGIERLAYEIRRASGASGESAENAPMPPPSVKVRKPNSRQSSSEQAAVEGDSDTPIQTEVEEGAPQPALHDDLIKILVDGSEEDRANLIERLKTDTSIDLVTLGERLRSEITGRFNPERTGSMNLEDYISVRSWMLSALIWADLEQKDSEQIFLRHINQVFEPESTVRFWVLAGLYQRRARILPGAAKLCTEDSSAGVRAMAQAALVEDRNLLVEQFRSTLVEHEPSVRFGVLRVLRIVPMKELLPEVCQIIESEQPGSRVSFAALRALAHPEVIHDAAARLEHSPGIDKTVGLVLAAATPGDSYANRPLGLLLAEFDNERVRRAMRPGLEFSATRATAESLIEIMDSLRTDEEMDDIYIAGYTSDFIDDNTELDDSLGIEEDVKTLTAVMLAQDVQAPLAIGLFGDWGSGKSYFMQSMYAEVEDLRKHGASELFRKDVCQIRFNAWHYVDTNLWASLVSTILERLAAHVSPEDTPEKKEAALIKELGTAKAIKVEAQAEKEGAQAQVTEKQRELQKLQIQREEKEIALTEFRVSDLAAILDENDGALKKDLEESLQELGVPAAVDSVSDLSNVLEEANSLRSRSIAFAYSIVQGRNRWLILGALVLVLIIIPLIAAFAPSFIPWFTNRDLVVKGVAILGQITVAVGSLTVVLRSAVSHLKSGLEKVEKAKLKIDKRIAEKRQTPAPREIQLQNEIAQLKAREHEATSHLDAAAAKVVALEEQIRAIEEGRSLARFLAERTNSEDYRKHLGLISTIRKDFDSLAKTLSVPAITAKGERLAVDRIILYIDDLDRCPENKVMDVLQAVHLLLAYPLFVVVVGVDPRWLLHSLGTTYSAFQVEDDGNGGGKWRTTPQNYLEKIFQIPFNLNRMTSPGYGKLLDTLMGEAPPKKEVKADALKAESKATDTTTDDNSKVIQPKNIENEDDAQAKEQTPQNGEAVASTDLPPPHTVETVKIEAKGDGGAKKDKFIVRKEALVIRSWEREFAESLYPLIPTPRAAKRFSNIYRICKARVRREHLAAFEGTKEHPGHFRIPMLLLAMLIGSPEACTKLFPAMLERAGRNLDLSGIFLPLINNAQDKDVEALHGKIDPIISEPDFPDTPKIYVDWVPRIARFSFDVGRAVQTER